METDRYGQQHGQAFRPAQPRVVMETNSKDNREGRGTAVWPSRINVEQTFGTFGVHLALMALPTDLPIVVATTAWCGRTGIEHVTLSIMSGRSVGLATAVM
jgi:hypothetical protein